MNSVTDVVVIGAGIVGCCAAFHLAQMGKRVTVVEKGSIASGMTKRSGALVHAFFSDEPTARLAMHSLSGYPNWKNAIGGDCGYNQSGLVVTVPRDADAEQLKKNATMLGGIGVNSRILSPEGVRERAERMFLTSRGGARAGPDLSIRWWLRNRSRLEPANWGQSFRLVRWRARFGLSEIALSRSKRTRARFRHQT
jgi:glycine/D-amino acid oxidase-like deaminating enzyme